MPTYNRLAADPRELTLAARPLELKVSHDHICYAPYAIEGVS
jgi:hypothetical protein